VLREGLTQLAIMLALAAALAGSVWVRIHAPAVVFRLDGAGNAVWLALTVTAIGRAAADWLCLPRAAPPTAPTPAGPPVRLLGSP
jgi:hypothetical protein